MLVAISTNNKLAKKITTPSLFKGKEIFYDWFVSTKNLFMKKLSTVVCLAIITLYSCELDTNFVQKPESPREATSILERNFKNRNIGFDEKTEEIVFPKETIDLEIPRGATLSQLGQAAYKDLLFFEENYDFGGIKASYEIMSEINGIYDSKLIIAGDKIRIFSLGAMEMEIINPVKESNHLISRVMSNQVKIKSIKAK